jgi:hypothetical protein
MAWSRGLQDRHFDFHMRSRQESCKIETFLRHAIISHISVIQLSFLWWWWNEHQKGWQKWAQAELDRTTNNFCWGAAGLKRENYLNVHESLIILFFSFRLWPTTKALESLFANYCQIIFKIDVTNFDTLTRLWHRKSSNSIDSLKTAEGTIGAPTCSLTL